MELVEFRNGETVTSSLTVAEVFEKQHKHVLEAIKELEGMVENSADLFTDDFYEHPQNKQSYRQVIMNEKGWTLLVMGFTGKKSLQFKLKYIEEFSRMKNHIKQQTRLPQTPMETLKLMFQVQEETADKLENVEKEVMNLKENVVLSAGDYSYIARRINQRVSEVARGFKGITQKQRGELYKDINSGVKKIAGVGSRTQLRERHYDLVVEFISDWEPSTATKTIVRQMSLEI
ncbi:Rha family transcriptional regulator (plasmid) [Vagococcus intermedius]|uniref:Rha family transcriptional regulator n=1 Tax=Vagococcus intermedius TaxID=2991418 RepID=A0AAF0I8V6_9ENTE|nr:Rha family transcriptional regulator [Vagococcus intermedius]WEG74386.1 Rha family transcriptional regulator [Vagococcus intermedius]